MEKGVWSKAEDELLRWTSQQYADERTAFGIIDKLLGYKTSELYNLEDSFITHLDVQEILKMCAKYNYVNIGTKVTDIGTLPILETGQLLRICAENDSVEFAETLIQCKQLNSEDLADIECVN